MSDLIYERLAKALDQLPNGFPRTDSQAEIKILKKIFSPEEASLAGNLSGVYESVEEISQRANLPTKEVGKQLFQMVRRGLVWLEKQQGQVQARFRLAPFVVGIYEAQLELMDHELAHLVEDYLVNGGAAGIMKPQPALNRVLPAQNTVKSEWILPYDDVRAILMAAKSFHVQDCICRTQQDHLGRRCNFPLDMCLSFSNSEHQQRQGDIPQDQALTLLKRSEELGLVHTVSNVIQGVGYICNCCGCCCGILRGITEWGIENSVAYANYYAVIDSKLCTGCGICIERCQVQAISEKNGLPVVNRLRCIGCGLCVSGCPNNAARLERKPEAEIMHPPQDFAAWESARLHNRGLK
jgi:electron transport complex protein RnfB